MRRAALALAALAVAGGVALAGETAVKLVGKIAAAEKDGAFELKERRGTFKLTLDEKAAIVEHKLVPIKEASGSAHVLGRRQAPQHDASGGSVPAQIVGIVTVVVGDWKPPALPPDLEGKRLEWIEGGLSNSNGVAFSVGGTNMQIGADRKVVVVAKAEAAALTKGRPAIVEATLADAKAKEGVAKHVTLFAAETPAGELHAILGL